MPDDPPKKHKLCECRLFHPKGMTTGQTMMAIRLAALVAEMEDRTDPHLHVDLMDHLLQDLQDRRDHHLAHRERHLAHQAPHNTPSALALPVQLEGSE